jgi:hypothetical protein
MQNTGLLITCSAEEKFDSSTIGSRRELKVLMADASDKGLAIMKVSNYVTIKLKLAQRAVTSLPGRNLVILSIDSFPSCMLRTCIAEHSRKRAASVAQSSRQIELQPSQRAPAAAQRVTRSTCNCGLPTSAASGKTAAHRNKKGGSVSSSSYVLFRVTRS